MEMIASEKPLTAKESYRLSELERIIKDNLVGFVKVGKALEEIREQRLYRLSHSTFDEYCRDFWDMARRTADQLVAASNVVDNLSAIALKSNDHEIVNLLPANEAQARELARLKPAEQVKIWSNLVEETKAKQQEGKPAKITAKAVKRAVVNFKDDSLESRIQNTTKAVTRQLKPDYVSQDFSQAFTAMLEAIEFERSTNWKHTSRKTVHSYLWTILEEVAEAGPSSLDHTGCSMELGDREKLKKAGFKILLMDTKGLRINQWVKGDEWELVSDHATPAELSQAFKTMMKDPKNLRA